MHVNHDVYGEYHECLMCGHMVDVQKSSLLGIKMAGAKKKVTKWGGGRRTKTAAAARAA